MNKIFIMVVMVLCLVAVSSRLAEATTDIIGNHFDATPQNVNLITASPFTASASGTIVSIDTDWNNTVSCDFVVGLYADSGSNSPESQALLTSSASTARTGSTGIQNVNVTQISIVSGTKYWVAITTSTSAYCRYNADDTLPTDWAYVNVYVGTLPNPFATGNNFDNYATGHFQINYYGTAANPPQFFGNISTLPANYVYQDSPFSVSWKNVTDKMNNALLEINTTGSLVNYTMTQTAQNATYTDYQLLNNLGAGTYKYRFIGNTTAGLQNATSYATSTIGKAANVNLDSIFCNPSTGALGSIVLCSGAESASGDSDVNYTLWRNESLVLNSSLGSILTHANVTYNGTFPTGIWNIRFNSTSGNNWTANLTGLTAIMTQTNTPHSINILNPANVTYGTNDNPLTISYNANDFDSGHTHICLAASIHNSSTTITLLPTFTVCTVGERNYDNGTTITNTTTLGAGEYFLNVTARDRNAAGNIWQNGIWFDVLTSQNVINIFNPLNATYTVPYNSFNSLTFNVSAYDNDPSDSTFKLSVMNDGVSIYGNNTYSNNSFVYGLFTNTVGNHNLTVNTTDHAGFTNSTTLNYYVDWQPSIIITSPVNSTYILGSNITTSLSAIDDDTNFELNATLDGSLIFNYTNDTYVNGTVLTVISSLGLGTHVLKVITGDSDETSINGNNDTNTQTLYFTIQGSIPETFQYFCQNSQSIENHTFANGTQSLQGIGCNFGCDATNSLNYHQGAVPQADVCNGDPFNNYLWIFAIVIVLIVGGVIIYKKAKI